TKLQFVKSQIGGIDTMPPRKETSAPPPSLEIEEPVPTLESLEEEPAMSLEIDSVPTELDLSGFTSAAAPPPPTHLAPAVEIAADEQAAEGGDDLDFITEHLTEAEVFAKYGLAEKAAEHLRAIIERSPKHLAAHEKLYRILLDEGDTAGARSAAAQYVALLEEKGDAAAIDVVKNDFTSRGQSLGAPAAAPKKPAAAAPPPPPPPPPTVAPEEEFSLDFESEAAAEPAFEVPLPEPEPAPIEEEISLEAEAPAPVEELTFEPSPEPELSLGEPEAAEEQPFFGVEAESSPLEVEEEPAPLAFEEPEPIAPPPPPPPPPAAPRRPPTLSRGEIESELLSAIPDEDELPVETAPPPPPPAPAAPPPQAPVMTKAQEENLFADEENFFDLAAELESELVEDAGEQISLSEEEQSLEEIFKEFKKGVEQQLDSEDYDTHYNLGIAYKEMGLIDEAIGEFQLASKDPKRAVECASMLGLCFLEKGMPQLAIKWYRKGLEIPDIKEEEHLGLLYDLGSAYVDVGDNENAQKAFMEVYGLNTNYRDVATRIKQLESAR
ncbi:MAG TPA: tetratricopeptide repeat protein, partial [Thermoanaerobaculia bacterium]